MSIYAWKISSNTRVYSEKIGTLEQLEADLDALDLPLDRSSKEVISFAKLMQDEGQGVYRFRNSADVQQHWALVWIELAQGV